MKIRDTISPEAFEHLLAWLNGDRLLAGQEYQRIHLGLVKLFSSRGLADAEELADEAIDRVCQKVKEISAGYEGNPSSYFYGVARHILQEQARRKTQSFAEIEVAIDPLLEEDENPALDCLQVCLKKLTAPQRKMILSYYKGEGKEKIKMRNKLAEANNISVSFLRVKVHRIKEIVEACVKTCLRN